MKFKKVNVKWEDDSESQFVPKIIKCAPVTGKIDRALKIARKIQEKKRWNVCVQTHNFNPISGEYMPHLEAWVWIAR